MSSSTFFLGSISVLHQAAPRLGLLVKAGVEIVDVLLIHLLLSEAQRFAKTIKVEWIAELLKESAETRVNTVFGAVLYLFFIQSKEGA